MPTSFPDKDVEHGSRISSPEMDKRKSMKVESPSAWHMILERITAVLKCLFTKRMMLLFMLFINNGYGQVVVSSQITRQMKNVDQVGLAMAVYSIVEVITTVVCGYTADRLGNRAMIGIATLVEILGLFSTLYMIPSKMPPPPTVLFRAWVAVSAPISLPCLSPRTQPHRRSSS